MGVINMVKIIFISLFFSTFSQAEFLEDVDFDGGNYPSFHISDSGSLNLYEFRDGLFDTPYDNYVAERRPITVTLQGQPALDDLNDDRYWPSIHGPSADKYMRFKAYKSKFHKDRSELVIKRGLVKDRVYNLRFDLNLPRESSYYKFPGLSGEWFLITQIRQDALDSNSPPISLNLRRDVSNNFYIDLVTRNDYNNYNRVASLPIDGSRFTLNRWNKLLLKFKMGNNGYVELWSANNSKSVGDLERFGSRTPASIGYNHSPSHYLKMGLYRGHNPVTGRAENAYPLKKGYYINIDNIELWSE